MGRQQRVLSELKTLIVDVVSIPEQRGDRSGAGFFADIDEIKPDTPLAELGMDSIIVTALVSRIEDHFRITLSPMMMFEIHTVGDLVSQIEESTSE